MDPLTISLLGGGLTGLSALFGSNAQDKVNAARAQVLGAERARQAGYDAEADKINTGAQNRYQNFGDQQAARATQLADLFKTPVVTPTTPNTIAALPPTSGGIVDREIANKSNIAKDYVAHNADTLADLRSFGDLLGGISRDQANDAQRVGQIGNFKKGSSNVTAFELDAANRAGNADRWWSDLFGGLGKVGLTAGLSGTLAPLASAGGAGASAAAGAPLNILPDVARFAPSPLASVFSTGTTPFLKYGV